MLYTPGQHWLCVQTITSISLSSIDRALAPVSRDANSSYVSQRRLMVVYVLRTNCGRLTYLHHLSVGL
jgi:hypothetical protein